MSNKSSGGLQEELIYCPFNKSHKIQKSKLAWHLQRCQDKIAKEHLYTQCPYNSVHWEPTPKIDYHLKRCPDKPQQKDQSESIQEELDLKVAIAKQFGNTKRINDTGDTEGGKKKRIRGKNKCTEESVSNPEIEKNFNMSEIKQCEKPVQNIQHVSLNWAEAYLEVVEKRKKSGLSLILESGSQYPKLARLSQSSVADTSETQKSRLSCSFDKDSGKSSLVDTSKNESAANYGDDEYKENSSSISKGYSITSISSNRNRKNRPKHKTQDSEYPHSKLQPTKISKEPSFLDDSSQKESFSAANINKKVQISQLQNENISSNNAKIKKEHFDFAQEDEDHMC